MHTRWLRWIWMVCAVTVAVGCGSKKKAKPRRPARAVTGSPTEAVSDAERPATGASSATKHAAQATRAPRAATPTVAGAVPKKPIPRKDTVSLRFSRPGSDNFALPQAGKDAVVRVTPLDGEGNPIRELEPLGAGRLLVVAASRDLSWVKLLRADSFEGDGSRAFTIRFAKAGAHTLLVSYKPAGAPTVYIPSFLMVQGKVRPDESQGGAQLSWSGSRRLRANLKGAEGLDSCVATELRAEFSRGRKALSPDALDGGGVRYVVVPPDARELLWLEPSADGTGGKFKTTTPGSYALFALATVEGAQTAAKFYFVVGGEPADKCP